MPYFQIEKSHFSSEEFFAKNPQLKDNAVVLHLIPVDVLQRYPGLFNESELSGLDNLRPVPLDGLIEISRELTTQRHLGNAKLKEFFSSWETFFATHESPTKAEILSFRDELTNKLSGMFLK